jgi:hypothetical protein
MRRLPRLRALLLALLFVGAGSVAPVLDAVLYHRGNDAAARPHVEMRDNPSCHGERCVLPLFQATSGGAPAVRQAPVPAGGHQLAVLRPATDLLPPARHPGNGRSRAPPSLLA